jgi:hypothetical protein
MECRRRPKGRTAQVRAVNLLDNQQYGIVAMTKLLDRIDSAATKGARKQATQSHASMLKVGPYKSAETKVEIKTFHGSQGQKITIRPKPQS